MNIFIIAQLTFHEARRKKVVSAGLYFGLAFLALYAVATYFIVREALAEPNFNFGVGALLRTDPNIRQTSLNLFYEFLALAGLYAVNFLTVMMSVLTPVDTLSGEIASGAIQSLATKPMRRAEIVLGKWLGFWLLCMLYVTLMVFGVIVIVKIMSGFLIANAALGLLFMMIECSALIALSIAGGARLGTLANGVMGFGMFGIAFIGGWIEQIGARADISAARNVGVIASLIAPSETMWRLSAYYMQSPLMREIPFTPFSSPAVPSNGMVAWTLLYIVVLLVVAIRVFGRRDL